MLELTPIKVSQGAFRSILMLKVYSVHAYKILPVTHRYRSQIGALALATAAVCGSIYSSQVHNRIIHPSRSNMDLDCFRRDEMIGQKKMHRILYRPQVFAKVLGS